MTHPESIHRTPRSVRETVRGRKRGLEIEWTPERFADAIRRDVAIRAEKGWCNESIWSWVRLAHSLTEESIATAKSVLDEVLREEPLPAAPGLPTHVPAHATDDNGGFPSLKGRSSGGPPRGDASRRPLRATPDSSHPGA